MQKPLPTLPDMGQTRRCSQTLLDHTVQEFHRVLPETPSQLSLLSLAVHLERSVVRVLGQVVENAKTREVAENLCRHRTQSVFRNPLQHQPCVIPYCRIRGRLQLLYPKDYAIPKKCLSPPERRPIPMIDKYSRSHQLSVSHPRFRSTQTE